MSGFDVFVEMILLSSLAVFPVIMDTEKRKPNRINFLSNKGTLVLIQLSMDSGRYTASGALLWKSFLERHSGLLRHGHALMR